MERIIKTVKELRLIHLCLAITFFTSGVVVNVVQLCLYFTLRPFNRTLYRKINWYLCFTIYSQLVFLGDWWSGSRIVLYIDKCDFDQYYGKEHAFCIMNHTYEVDWLIGWMNCDRLGMLGNCKAYAKKVIQYVPVLGWAWKCAEFVFLDRSFDKDKDVINRQVRELAEHPDPMWLLLFPEGTRFTLSKHRVSVDYAKANNLPELQHHLLPRTRGFLASLPSMYGKVPAIYDIELAFEEDAVTKPTIKNMLMGKPVIAHMYMRRIPLDDMPSTAIEQEEFLRKLFVRKDRLQASFKQTGCFFKTSGVPSNSPFEISRRQHSLFNTIAWLVAVLLPLNCYLIQLLCNCRLLHFSICIAVIGAFYVLLNKTIGMSEIDKGSSYGGTSPKKVC